MTKYFCAALIVWRPTLSSTEVPNFKIFCAFNAKEKETTPMSQKRTALSAGGLEASAEEVMAPDMPYDP